MTWTADDERELRQLAWMDWQITKCKRKVRFFSQQAAETSMQRFPHSKRTPPKMTAYKCSWCSGWHRTTLKQIPPAMRAAA